jgi:hypothetical protein
VADTPSSPGTGLLCLNGLSGSHETRVLVVGETPKQYRIEADRAYAPSQPNATPASAPSSRDTRSSARRHAPPTSNGDSPWCEQMLQRPGVMARLASWQWTHLETLTASRADAEQARLTVQPTVRPKP